MTDVLITCDTELSAGLHQRPVPLEANVLSSIWGAVEAGRFGIGWQMDRLEEHGLAGVFFIDPMPALIHGRGFLDDVVGAVLERGHEVQLHIHTEWLEWASASPVEGRRGRNIGDFDLSDQKSLIEAAMRLLAAAGAPPPIAFRAGNYGADDRTLAALAALGFLWDSSFNAAYLGSSCRIGLPAETRDPIARGGVVEVPVAVIRDRPGHLRPAQLCAVSAREMREALHHAVHERQPAFVIVSHSFEMLSRDRARPNRLVMRRFEALCREVAGRPDLRAAGFRDLPPDIADRRPAPEALLPPNLLRTGERMLQQTFANILYDRRLTPA